MVGIACTTAGAWVYQRSKRYALNLKNYLSQA